MTFIKSYASSARHLTCVLGLALALAGCGSKLDMGVISKSINDGLSKNLGLANLTVACPTEPRTPKADDTFDCDVKFAEGGHLVVTVTQKDDKGNVDWKVTKSEGLVHLATAEEEIKKGIKEQVNVDATVACEGTQRVRPAKPGDTFDCKVTTADGGARTAKVTVKNANGLFSWGLEKPERAEPAEAAETPEPEH